MGTKDMETPCGNWMQFLGGEMIAWIIVWSSSVSGQSYKNVGAKEHDGCFVEKGPVGRVDS